MNMTFALLACFQKPAVPLKEVCQEYLGLLPKTAEQKAKAGTLQLKLSKWPSIKM